MVNYIRSSSGLASASSEIIVSDTNALANIRIDAAIFTGASVRVGTNTRYRWDGTSTVGAGVGVVIPNDGTNPGRWLIDPPSPDFGNQTIIAGGANINGDILVIGQADTVHIQVRAFSAQTVDQTQWQTSTGQVQAAVSANGSLFATRNTTSAVLGASPGNANSSALYLGGVTPATNNFSLLGTASGNLTINTPGVGGTLILRSQSSNPVIQIAGNNLGFFNTAPIAKPAVTGSGFTAISSLATALSNLGLITSSIGVASKVTVTGATYIVQPTDYIILCNRTTNGTVTITLESTPADGKFLIIKDMKGDATTNNIIINRANTQTIELALSYTINVNRNAVEMCFDAISNNWNVV